jgi:hypothetical protein
MQRPMAALWRLATASRAYRIDADAFLPRASESVVMRVRYEKAGARAGKCVISDMAIALSHWGDTY